MEKFIEFIFLKIFNNVIKNESQIEYKIEDKIDFIYNTMFRDNRYKSTFNQKNGYDKILNRNLIDPNNNNIAFDYLKKLDEILIESKKIIFEKIFF